LSLDTQSNAGGDGMILQKRRLIHRTGAGDESKTTCAEVMDKRELTSSGSLASDGRGTTARLTTGYTAACTAVECLPTGVLERFSRIAICYA